MNESSGHAKALLLLALALLSVFFVVVWVISARRAQARVSDAVPGLLALAIGALTDFLDALGIGSYAPTTSLYKLTGVVSDEEIPGTMNIGHAVPTFAEGPWSEHDVEATHIGAARAHDRAACFQLHGEVRGPKHGGSPSSTRGLDQTAAVPVLVEVCGHHRDMYVLMNTSPTFACRSDCRHAPNGRCMRCATLAGRALRTGRSI